MKFALSCSRLEGVVTPKPQSQLCSGDPGIVGALIAFALAAVTWAGRTPWRISQDVSYFFKRSRSRSYAPRGLPAVPYVYNYWMMSWYTSPPSPNW